MKKYADEENRKLDEINAAEAFKKSVDKIKELAETVQATVGYEGKIIWNSDMPDGTPRKLTNVDKLHSIGWTHKVELAEGVKLAYDWFKDNVDTARM